MSQSVAPYSVGGAVPAAAFLATEQRQYLTFSMGREIFAVEILAIKEILRYGAPTEVPLTHPWLVGVINLRGRVVPVIDLAVRLGREPVQIGRRTCIVITEVIDSREAEAVSLEMGLIVDAVRAVVDIPSSAVEPPPAFGVRLHPEYMLGVTRQDDFFIVLLDLEKIFTVSQESLAPIMN